LEEVDFSESHKNINLIKEHFSETPRKTTMPKAQEKKSPRRPKT
jgi:hypothetical protein